MPPRAESGKASHSLSGAADHSDGPLGFVRRRWRTIVAVWVLTLMAAGIYLMKARPQFTSTASIYVQPTGPRNVGGAEKPAVSLLSSNFLNTQREIISSVPVIAAAVADPEISGLKTFSGIENPVDWLRGQMRVEVGKTDDIIHIALETPDARESAQIVNAIVDSYVKFQTGQQHSTSSKVVDSLRKEKGDTDARAADIDHTMREFQKQAGMMSFDQKAHDSIWQQLLTYRQEVTAAHIKGAEAKSAYDEAVMAWGNAPLPADDAGKSESSIVVASEADQAAMRTAMSKAADLLAALRAKYLPQHPYVKDAADRLQNLKARYLTATRRHMQVAEQREKQLREALAAEEKTAADFAEQSANYARLDSEKRQLEGESSVLGSRIREVRLDVEAGVLNVSVLETATPEFKPTRPNRLMTMLMALGAGFLGGLVLAFVRDQTDPNFRSPVELEAAIDVPVLGCVPAGSRTAGNLNPANPVPLDRWSDSAETCRQIASSFNAVCPKGFSPAVLVTSPRSGDGRSTVARDLAIALAGAGQHVLLIDADFQNPSLHSLVGTRNLDGLSNVVSGELAADLAAAPTSIAGLDVMTTGPAPALPAAMFDSPEFDAFLKLVSSQYDRVLLDAPPVGGGSNDARIAALACGAALLVLPQRKLNKRLIRDTRDRLIGFGVPVVAIVLNDSPRRRASAGAQARRSSVSTLQTLSRMVADGHEKPSSRIRQITSSSQSSR
jgi:capsular exopolysaccharide synthesis family protein